MGRKRKYLEIYLDPRLSPLLDECLENPTIQAELIARHLPATRSGVAKLAVDRFLEGIGKLPVLGKQSHSKAV